MAVTENRTSAMRVAREVRVPKIAELVAAHVRRQIVRGELREGDALPPEAALMEQFRISRPTLREAYRVLESEALITVRRGSHGGARVHVPNGDVAARYGAAFASRRADACRLPQDIGNRACSTGVAGSNATVVRGDRS